MPAKLQVERENLPQRLRQRVIFWFSCVHRYMYSYTCDCTYTPHIHTQSHTDTQKHTPTNKKENKISQIHKKHLITCPKISFLVYFYYFEIT